MRVHSNIYCRNIGVEYSLTTFSIGAGRRAGGAAVRALPAVPAAQHAQGVPQTCGSAALRLRLGLRQSQLLVRHLLP